MGPVDCVVFDFGGVLIRIARSWRERLERAGLPDVPVVDDPAFIAAADELYVELEAGRATPRDYYEGVAGASGGALDPDQTKALHRAVLVAPYPGTDALMNDLEALGVRLAVLSNTNEPHWRRMRALEAGPPEFPPLHRPSSAVASFEVGIAKPEPGIYRVLERLVEAPAERLLFFDDGPQNVDGARACGWQAELIDYDGDTAAQMRAHLRTRGLAV